MSLRHDCRGLALLGGRANGLQRAFAAARAPVQAQRVAKRVDERMVLIVQRCVGRQVVHEKPAQFLIGRLLPREAKPEKDAPRVRIDDERRLMGGIQNDVVGGLRANAPHGEQARAQFVRGQREQTTCVAPELPVHHGGERLEFFRLHVVIERRNDAFFNPFHRRPVQGRQREQAASAQAVDRRHHILPRHVLHKNRADDHFFRRLGRPPTAVTVVREQPLVDSPQCRRRLTPHGDPPPF